mgnify:CR=1 FL=1
MVAIPGGLLRQIVAHAAGEPAREVCGVVLARNGAARSIRVVRNISDQPASRYVMHPVDFERAARSGELFAIYHSHIDRDAMPSRADERGAFLPGGGIAFPSVYYLIVSLTHEPTVRAWLLAETVGGIEATEELVEAWRDEPAETE